MRYEIEHRDGIFFVRLSGKARTKALLQYYKELFGHPQWEKDSLLLTDSRGLDKEWDESKMFSNVSQAASGMANYSTKLEGARMAVLIDPDSKVSDDYSIFNTLINYMQVPVHREVFHDRQKALDWLRLK